MLCYVMLCYYHGIRYIITCQMNKLLGSRERLLPSVISFAHQSWLMMSVTCRWYSNCSDKYNSYKSKCRALSALAFTPNNCKVIGLWLSSVFPPLQLYTCAAERVIGIDRIYYLYQRRKSVYQNRPFMQYLPGTRGTYRITYPLSYDTYASARTLCSGLVRSMDAIRSR